MSAQKDTSKIKMKKKKRRVLLQVAFKFLLDTDCHEYYLMYLTGVHW